MSTRRFELSTTVRAAPEGALDFLARLDAHRGMHPYLESAEVERSGRDATGPWQDWRVVERPRLGPLRYTIAFPARMIRVSPTELRGRVRAAPGCFLETVTTVRAAGSGAVVDEMTVVTAPWMLVDYITRHARLAHTRTFSLLDGELARR